jgi:hypothetical protein
MPFGLGGQRVGIYARHSSSLGSPSQIAFPSARDIAADGTGGTQSAESLKNTAPRVAAWDSDQDDGRQRSARRRSLRTRQSLGTQAVRRSAAAAWFAR